MTEPAAELPRPDDAVIRLAQRRGAKITAWLLAAFSATVPTSPVRSVHLPVPACSPGVIHGDSVMKEISMETRRSIRPVRIVLACPSANTRSQTI